MNNHKLRIEIDYNYKLRTTNRITFPHSSRTSCLNTVPSVWLYNSHQCVYFCCVFQETHLTINDSPGPRDFVVTADPVVDGLGWLGQVDLRYGVTQESTCWSLTFFGPIPFLVLASTPCPFELTYNDYWSECTPMKRNTLWTSSVRWLPHVWGGNAP